MDEFYVCWCISMIVDAVLTLGFSIEYLNAQKLYNTFVVSIHFTALTVKYGIIKNNG